MNQPRNAPAEAPAILWSRRSLFWVALIGTILTVSLTWCGYDFVLREYHKQFDFDARTRSHLLTEYLSERLEDLDAVRRFIEVSSGLTRSAYRNFAGAFVARSGIQALEWIPVVPDSRRQQAENAAVRDGLGGFRFREKTAAGEEVPASVRDFYYPVYFAEPLQGNEKALGFDLGSNPARLQAIHRTEATGEPIATAPLKLVQEQGSQTGFLVFMPVKATAAGERGFALGVFRADDMLAAALDSTEGVPLVTTVSDLSGASGPQPLSTWRKKGGGGQRTTAAVALLFPLPALDTEFAFAGRRWMVRTEATPQYRSATVSLLFLAILPAGLLITALLTLYIRNLLKHSAEVECQVADRTADLTDLNNRLTQEIAGREAVQKALLDQQQQLEELNLSLEQRVAVEVQKNRDKDQALMQSDKMASLGQLAAGVAHEINNPVAFISSNLNTLTDYFQQITGFDRLLQEADPSHLTPETIARFRAAQDLEYVLTDSVEVLSESLDGIQRVAQIVRDLASFSRLDTQQKEPMDVNTCLERTLTIVNNELKYVAVIRKEYGDVPKISCIPGQLNQVFLNLLVNAGHAITPPGAIVLRSWHDDDFVYASVSDTGKGIPEEVRSRIFEPFFTTKEEGKGTGLGLSISHDIVKAHGGEITVESEVDKGTTFTIKLPRYGDSGEEQE